MKNVVCGGKIRQISHVTELEQEIDDQHVVMRGEKGSNEVWQH